MGVTDDYEADSSFRVSRVRQRIRTCRITHIAIVEAVNAKLPPAEKFGELGWYPMKSLRLHREYRRLYPGGALLRREGRLAYGALFSLVVTATLLGFGVLGIVWVGGGGGLSLWFLYFRDRPLSN